VLAEPFVTVKIALLEPGTIAPNGGTVTLVALALRLTVAPPEPVVPLRFTVQELEAPALNAAGLHTILLTVNREPALTDPPVDETTTASPVDDAPIGLLTAIAAVDVAVMDTVATIPLAIELVPFPEARHI